MIYLMPRNLQSNVIWLPLQCFQKHMTYYFIYIIFIKITENICSMSLFKIKILTDHPKKWFRCIYWSHNKLLFIYSKNGAIKAGKRRGRQGGCRISCKNGSWVPEEGCAGKHQPTEQCHDSWLHRQTCLKFACLFFQSNRVPGTLDQMSSGSNKKQKLRSIVLSLKPGRYHMRLPICFWGMLLPLKSRFHRVCRSLFGRKHVKNRSFGLFNPNRTYGECVPSISQVNPCSWGCCFV